MALEPRRDTREAAEFLTENGFRTAPATLNKLRCIGGGPEFELFGRRPLYSEKSLLEMGSTPFEGARAFYIAIGLAFCVGASLIT
jgi:hypothetical protein